MNTTGAGFPEVHFIPANFGIADYVVFGAFLCISGAVGIFFSLRGQKTTGEYFHGARSMSWLPVGISTGVSFMSALAMIGTPSEMYINGYSYFLATVSGSAAYVLCCIVIIRILHPLDMSTLNEYFEKRFQSRALNICANVMVILSICHYMGGCMLGSILALESMTGGQITFVTGLVVAGSVGVFYTTIGGLKAVVWTDVLQTGVMFLGIVVVIVRSIVDTPGGMRTIIEQNVNYGRFHAPNWSPDFTVRHTMWGLLFGYAFDWASTAAQPAGVIRLCSIRSKTGAFWASVVAGLLFLIFSFLPAWAGVNVFGFNSKRGCDLYAAGWIEKNAVLTYYVRERLSVPGFQGLFSAALFAASLSSLSSGLNAAGAILWKGVIKPNLRREISEARATLISKFAVLIFGVLGMTWCYFLSSFGGLIIQISSTMGSSMFGPYMGLFIVGTCFRCVGYKGALAGIIVSFLTTFALGIGKLFYGPSTDTALPSITSPCSKNETDALGLSLNSTLTPHNDPLFPLFSISYLWMTMICIISFAVTALLVTACTGSVKPKVDRKLLLEGNLCCYGKRDRHRNNDVKDEIGYLPEKDALVKMKDLTLQRDC